MSSKFDVVCSLPNASDNISGVPFDWNEKDQTRIARDLTADQAGLFRGIEGYQILDAKGGAQAETAAEKKARLKAEAAEAEAAEKQKAADEAKAAEEAAAAPAAEAAEPNPGAGAEG